MIIDSELDARLNSFLELEDKWDSYGGVPITNQAVDAARRIINESCRTPEVGPLPNGGIDIEWGELLVKVQPGGQILGWAMYKDGQSSHGIYTGNIIFLISTLPPASPE